MNSEGGANHAENKGRGGWACAFWVVLISRFGSALPHSKRILV